MWKVQLFKLNYDDREVKAVTDVLRSGWITMGEKTTEFERKFADFLGEGPIYCTATSSGTAALHLAMIASNIRSDDEVIIPALTFVADINVVRISGARAVLADCTSYDDWNISPKEIKRKITDKTKAIIVVHYAGFPCEMDEILSIVSKANKERMDRGLAPIKLIEDAAHAPGAKYKGVHCGTMGDIGCFSFFTNKNLSVGEGGMFVTKDKDLDSEARYIRSHGMTTLTLDRHKGRAISYDVKRVGLNYRIDEMRAALGLVQLDKLPEANRARELLVREYYRLLDGQSAISIPFQHIKNRSMSYHIFPILLDPSINREAIITGLKDKGIQASIHYPAFHDFSTYHDLDPDEVPITTEIAQREITLPLYPTMGLSKVKCVCDALKAVIKG